jgi:hypothetical protein
MIILSFNDEHMALVAAFVEHMALEKASQSSLLCRRVFFFGGKSIEFGKIQRILTSPDSHTSQVLSKR